MICCNQHQLQVTYFTLSMLNGTRYLYFYCNHLHFYSIEKYSSEEHTTNYLSSKYTLLLKGHS